VIHNTGMPKIGIYFCLRCFGAFTCCFRRLQALGGPASYMPASGEYPGVLELAGMEATFFIATCMVLCFKLVSEIVLLTPRCFYYS